MKKILIVDDDGEIRTSLSYLLKEVGYYTCAVPSGKDAIEKATLENFDIALIDVIMPGMSGIDTITELRRLSPKTQVIMITGFPAIEDAIDAIKKGACDYITKPFKSEDLFFKTRRAIEKIKGEQCMNKLNIDQTLNVLASPLRRNILEFISSKINARLTDIARGLDITDLTKIIFHMKHMKETGLIKHNNTKSYSLTPEGEKILDCLKIINNYLSNKSTD
jgi:DNA-binding NtrC family response regulator